MVEQLRIRTLGGLSIEHDGEAVSGFASSKAELLLVYLACHPREQRREVLADLLWDERTPRRALGNLRVVLASLRKVTGPFVMITRTTAAVRSERVWLDAAALEEALAGEITVDSAEAVAAALALYQGDFLEGVHVRDARGFEEWAARERERLHRLAVNGGQRLVRHYLARGAYQEGVAHAARLLEWDPLLEPAHRQMMVLLARSGQRAAALDQYERCQQILDDELGMAPARRTTATYEQIVAGDLRFEAARTPEIRGYQLKEEIGQGRFGTVYRAEQPTVNRDVAVKVIRREYADDPSFIRRFEAEAQTIARLEHPHVVPLYDYWRDPEGAYLVMRLFRGGNLEDALAQGAWEAEPTRQLLEQIAAALAAAHRQGIVHRDIKPANILFDEAGNAYLSDFGIAKDMGNPGPTVGNGARSGTSDYSSPEELRAEAVSQAADVYSLGVVLFQALTGERPFAGSPPAVRLQKRLQEPLPAVSERRPALPEQLDQVIWQATAKQPEARYPDALALAAAFSRALRGEGLEPLPPEVVGKAAVAEVANPYKGLRAFEESDADHFFGRERTVEQLLSHLAESRFLAVVGPSGSGKSSLVNAGLIPALRRGALPDSEKWFVAQMVPGSRPLEELALALLPVAVDPPPNLLAPLEKDERGLLRTVRRILPDEEGAQLVLVIDQFEELFTQVADRRRRQHFVDSLVTAVSARQTPLRIVVTLRADFYDRPLQMQALAELFKAHTEIILPLKREELVQVIEEPARQVGVGVEGALAATIVADVADQPGTLPLLQYALTELFEAREENVMTLGAYRALDGVRGALARRAEELFSDLDPGGKEATRQLFLRLVTLGEGEEDTRRRVRRSELRALGAGREERATLQEEHLETAISEFGRYRLLTFDRDPANREPTVEVAHEALLREWPRLRQWLNQNRDDIRLQRRLGTAAADWIRAGREASYLLRGSRLDLFTGWVATTNLMLTDEEQAYLDASAGERAARRAAEEARRKRELETAQQLALTEQRRAEEQSRAAQRLRRRALYLSGALLAAALLAIVALLAGRQARLNAGLASTREGEALVLAAERATAQANAETERLRADEERASAEQAQATAEAEAVVRATAQAQAIVERETAERQARLAQSRELAGLALDQLEVDQERAVLLALRAMETAETTEAENALHRALGQFRILQTVGNAESLGSVRSLALAPGASHLAVGNHAGELTLWDMEQHEEVRSWQAHGKMVNQVVFHPDGKRFATAGDDATVKVWALPTLLQIAWEDPGGRLAPQPMLTLTSSVTTATYMQAVTINPAGTRIAAISDASVHLWDMATGEELLTIATEPGLALAIQFSPDGEWLAAAREGTPANVWDAESGEWLRSFGTGDYTSGIGFSPDGAWVATGAPDGTVSIWDRETGALRHTLEGHSAGVYEPTFTPDSAYLVTRSEDTTIRVWDVAAGRQVTVLAAAEGMSAMALEDRCTGPTADPFVWCGPRLVTGGGTAPVRVWDLTPGGGRELLTVPGYDAWFSANGGELVSVYGAEGPPQANRVGVWRVPALRDDEEAQAAARHVFPVEAHSPFKRTGAALTQDQTLLAIWTGDREIFLYDVASGEALRQFTVTGIDEGIFGAAFNPSGTRLATVGITANDAYTNLTKISNVDTGAAVLTLTVPGWAGWRVAYSPDGERLVTSARNEEDRGDTVAIWDATTGERLLSWPADPSVTWGATYSPDGQWLATGGSTLTLWDAQTGEEARTFFGDATLVMIPAFSPDGQRLATSSFDGTTRVWDVATGEELLRFEERLGKVRFSPDGRFLASTDIAGHVTRVYIIDREALMTMARDRVTRSLTEAECQQFLHVDSCPEG